MGLDILYFRELYNPCDGAMNWGQQGPQTWWNGRAGLTPSGFSIFPQVAFPCKMPDVTPEGNLGEEAPSQRGSPGT